MDSKFANSLTRRVKVLVVDDSAFMRYLITRELSAEPDIEVIGSARDGLDAVRKTNELKPDVVTMDLEMPKMDGLTALEHIMTECPTPVVLLSSLTVEGATVTIRGLELGAVDFVTKPSAVEATASRTTWEQLATRVRAAAGLDEHRLKSRPRQFVTRLQHVVARESSRETLLEPRRSSRVETVIVIGTSTGGPRALFSVIPQLPANLQAAVLLVQHMPPGFTRSLAARLNDVSNLEVREAADGDKLEYGRVLVAPGDFHMAVGRGGVVHLEQSPPIHGVRPAVDVTMESAASVFKAATVGVILTGMGRDGTSGALAVHRNGGTVISEHESTCVVYGMPRSVQESGASDVVVPLDAVTESILRAVATPKVMAGGIVR